MKKVVVFGSCILLVIMLSACCTSHEWDGGSCLESEKCIKCGKTKEGTKPIGHIASEWIIDKAMSCTENGMKHAICSKCGIEYNEIIESSGHNMSNWEKSLRLNEDTGIYACDGVQFRKCSLCGLEETQKTDLSLSEFESLVRILATECTYDDITFGETPDEYLKELDFYMSVLSFTGKVISLEDYGTKDICYVNISQKSAGDWGDTVRLFMPNQSFSIEEVIKVYGVYYGKIQTRYGEIPNIQAVCIER